MSKHTAEVKLQAVERYLTKNESYKAILESIGADKSLVINWVKLFEAQGEIKRPEPGRIPNSGLRSCLKYLSNFIGSDQISLEPTTRLREF